MSTSGTASSTSAGRFTPQGPDYEGQTRRLRSGDGVYFTKFGARKLAHYVEREIQRHITNRAVPVALPIPVEPQPGAKPGGPAQRPAVGPVVPLTAATTTAPEELMGGGRAARPRGRSGRDPRADQGRADSRPVRPCRRFQLATRKHAGRRAGCAAADPASPAGRSRAGASADRAVESRSAHDRHGRPGARDHQPPAPKRARSPDAPRPPLAIQGLQGLFR